MWISTTRLPQRSLLFHWDGVTRTTMEAGASGPLQESPNGPRLKYAFIIMGSTEASHTFTQPFQPCSLSVRLFLVLVRFDKRPME